jgi:hypothetical protein
MRGFVLRLQRAAREAQATIIDGEGDLVGGIGAGDLLVHDGLVEMIEDFDLGQRVPLALATHGVRVPLHEVRRINPLRVLDFGDA